MPTISQLRPWKALKSGVLTYNALLALLRARKIGYSTWAKDLLDRTHFPPYQIERQINFANLAPEELGLRTGDSTAEISRALREIGVSPELFMPVYAFELALSCADEQNLGTIVLPLPAFSPYTAMYVSSRKAGFRCSVRADQYPTPLEEGDSIVFVIPE